MLSRSYFDFHVIRGFKYFIGGARQAVHFPAKMRTMEQQSGGRGLARFPADPGDSWYDWEGVEHPAPVPPPNVPFRFLYEVQLNSGRINCTAHRGSIERSFAEDYHTKIISGRNPVPHQYLEPYGKAPTPHVPRIYVLLLVNMAIAVRVSIKNYF